MIDLTIADLESYFKFRARQQIGTIFLTEFGFHLYRFDLIAVNVHRRKVKIFEFKTSRSDFQRDKKWQNYLSYCNSFSFVTCNGYIKKEELPRGVGLLEITKKVSINSEGRELPNFYGDWLQRPGGRKLDQERYIEIISLMLNRAKHRPNDFF